MKTNTYKEIESQFEKYSIKVDGKVIVEEIEGIAEEVAGEVGVSGDGIVNSFGFSMPVDSEDAELEISVRVDGGEDDEGEEYNFIVIDDCTVIENGDEKTIEIEVEWKWKYEADCL